MSSVVVSGDTSGAITISAPAISGTNTLTLPVATDTLVGKANGSNGLTSTAPFAPPPIPPLATNSTRCGKVETLK